MSIEFFLILFFKLIFKNRHIYMHTKENHTHISHICGKNIIYKYIYWCMCLYIHTCILYMYMYPYCICSDVHRGHKRAFDSLKLEWRWLWGAQCEFWETNLDPVQENQVFLTTEPSPPFSFKKQQKYFYCLYQV